MPTPTPPSSPRAPGDPLAAPLRGSLKGTLLALLLLMLALLLWQLQQEFLQLQHNQRQRSHEYASQLANHLALSMELKAHAGLALLRQNALRPPPDEQRASLLNSLREIFPALRSLAWLNPRGGIRGDSAAHADDARLLASLLARSNGQPYHFAFSARAGGQVYLLLRQDQAARPSGYWALRLNPDLLRNWLQQHHSGEHPWLLEDRLAQRVIARQPEAQRSTPIVAPVTAEEQEQSILLAPLAGSDWQLRALFDARQVRAQLLPELAGKFLLFVFCSLLSLLALYGLQREQRSLRELNAASRRSLRNAAGALRAIEERVLVTQPNGQLSYLNPQAEQLFGLNSSEARGRHLLELLPGLDPLLLHGPTFPNDLGPDLVEVQREGLRRLFSVTRSDLGEDHQHAGHVWVLRDVTEEQQALRVLQETRRRYQDIFEGSGIALCVLDLAGLRQYLLQQELRSADDLARWLSINPQRHPE
ncbi:MAG: PAS domain S-box protein, partial [Pseudomonas sp.]